MVDPDSATSLLRLTNISMSFGGIKALNNLSFEVEENQTTCSIGPNGSGPERKLRHTCSDYCADHGSSA
ncbi:MAG: hypothetical protein QXV68_02280 [Candidatus Caldarchaeum sp.]